MAKKIKKHIKKFEEAEVMRDHLVKQLRKNSCIPGKQRTWISELSDEQLYQLFLRLRNGNDANSIARYIQKAWDVLPRSSHHSIAQGILKFRRRIAHLLLFPSENRNPIGPDSIEGADNLDGIARITKMQLDRINRMIAEEQAIGIQHNALSREIHALTALMKALAKAKKWEMMHEGYDPLTQRKWEAKKRKIENQFLSFLKNHDDHGHLIETLDRFLDRCEKKAITLNIGPDGEYTLAKHIEEA